MRRLTALVFLSMVGTVHSQTIRPNSLAGLVLAETSALDAAPDFAGWKMLHPSERVINPAYDNEYETQGLWCAASVSDFAFDGGVKVTRRAFFYPPPEKTADQLPAPNAGLLRHCRLLALWYEVSDPLNSGELVKSVSSEFNGSLGPSEAFLPQVGKRDHDWGSGYWNPYIVWNRANQRIILAVDPGGNVPDPRAHTRFLVIARSASVPHGMSFDWMGDPPKGQPELKDAPEVTRVARVERPCSFDDGSNNWQDGLILFGQQLLRGFPASRWAPYVHLTLARTYANKLFLTYPGVELDGANKPNNPDMLRRDAITHFKAFLAGNRESPEATSAWREAWRLLAGLPPSPIHFACTD